jgi:hypothetical protein
MNNAPIERRIVLKTAYPFFQGDLAIAFPGYFPGYTATQLEDTTLSPVNLQN